MAISFVAQTSAAATSVTLPSHNVGDYIVIFAHRSTTTAPSLPTGYISIVNGSGNSNSYRVGYKVATGSDTSGTWTNATNIQVVIYRGVYSIGTTSAVTHVAATSDSIPTITLQDNFSSHSWVLGFVGSNQITSQSNPTGMTIRGAALASATDFTVVADTNGGVSTFAAQTSTSGASAVYSSGSIELRGVNTVPNAPSLTAPTNAGTVVTTTPELDFSTTDPEADKISYEVQVDTASTFDSVSGGTPAWVQAASGANTTFASSVAATFSSTNTAGNAIILLWGGNGNSAPNKANTPTDTAGNTYIKLCSYGYQNGNGILSVDVWAALNIKSQASNVVTVTDTLGGANSELIVEEWSNVNQLSVVDQLATASGFTSAITASLPATLNAKDVIWSGVGTTWISAITFTAGAGFSNVTQTSDGSEVAIATQSQVVAATGSYTTPMTCSNTAQDFAMIAIALRNNTHPVIDANSAVLGTGFTDITAGGSSPYVSGDSMKYIVQSALTNSTTYNWRVRATDALYLPGSWSATDTFTVSAGGGTFIAAPFNPLDQALRRSGNF